MAMAMLRNDALPNGMYDLGHAIFPRLAIAWPTDTFFGSIADIWLVVAAITFLAFCSQKKRARATLIISFLYVLRTIVLLSTRYPTIIGSFQQPYVAPNTFLSAFLIMSFVRATIADLLPSGHSIVYVVSASFVARSNKPLIALCYWLFALTGMAFLLACRIHYTADVVVGALLSALSYHAYYLAMPGKTTWLRTFVIWVNKFFIG